jgi:hypothetical protein
MQRRRWIKGRANSKQKEGMMTAMRAHFLCVWCSIFAVGGIHLSGKLKPQCDLLGTIIRKFGDLRWNKDSYIFMFRTVCSCTLYVKMASPHVNGLPFLFTQKPHVVAMFSLIHYLLHQPIGGWLVAG